MEKHNYTPEQLEVIAAINFLYEERQYENVFVQDLLDYIPGHITFTTSKERLLEVINGCKDISITTDENVWRCPDGALMFYTYGVQEPYSKYYAPVTQKEK